MNLTNLSPHVSLREMTFSEKARQVGLSNEPPDYCVLNMTQLCATLLEPLRAMLGCQIHINSGYRSPALNILVGGQQNPPSAHLDGRAADFIPLWGFGPHKTLEECWKIIAESELPYDQLILEHSPKTGSTWIHVAIAAAGKTPRHEAFPLTKRELRLTNG